MAETAVEQPPAAHVHDALNDSASVEMETLDASEPQPSSSSDKKPPPNWWQRHVAQEVPFEACRDFYALERTYLSWVRTSVKFAHFGVLVTQLFRLPKDILPDSPAISQFFKLGKPMGIVSVSLAMVVIMIGGLRCWQQQRSIVSGHVQSCGWEIWVVVLLTLAYVVVLLVFTAGDAATDKPY